MSDIFESGNLKIEWQPFLKRKVKREMRALVLKGVQMKDQEKGYDVDLSNQDKAKDILILGMISVLYVKGEIVVPTDEWIGDLDNSIWEKLYEEATNRANKNAADMSEEALKDPKA